MFYPCSGIKGDEEFPWGLYCAKVLSSAVLSCITGTLLLPLFPLHLSHMSADLCCSLVELPAAPPDSLRLPPTSPLCWTQFLTLHLSRSVWKRSECSIPSRELEWFVQGYNEQTRQNVCVREKETWKPSKSQFCPLSQADLTIYSFGIQPCLLLMNLASCFITLAPLFHY